MIESCIWKCYDWPGDGLDILEVLKSEPYSFFLDSSINIYNLGRFSFLGYDPFFIFKTKKEKPFDKIREFSAHFFCREFVNFRKNPVKKFHLLALPGKTSSTTPPSREGGVNIAKRVEVALPGFAKIS